MKRILWLLLLCTAQAYAAVTYVGTGAVTSSFGTVTPALPAGNTGDLILCWAAHYNPNYTLPTPSSASYTELASGSTWTYHKVWGRIATGTDTFTLTATSGYLNTACSRFRGTSTNLASIVDAVATKRYNSTSIRIIAMTPTTNGDVLFYSLRFKGPGTTPVTTAVPTSFTERNDTYYSAANLLTSSGNWIQTTATAIAQQDIAVTPTPAAVGTNTSIVLALQAASGGGTPVITNVNTTDIFSSTATGLVITGTGFGASKGTGSVKIVDGGTSCTQTTTAWGDTSITFSAVLGSCRYGARNLQVNIDASGGSTQRTVTITAPTGTCYFDLTTLMQPFTVDAAGAPNRFGDAANDMTDGSQLEFTNMTFSGASTCASITVNSDGSYKVPTDLTSLDWRWNDGTAGWIATAVSRTGQNKVHIKESGGFRVSCSNNAGDNTAPPTRGAATKTICISGCDYPNTTGGIQNCMSAISNGQSCEMRSSTVDNTPETWAAQISLSSISGISGSPKTLRVRDGDEILLSLATGGTAPLLALTNVNHLNIQGNSTGRDGLHIGSPADWAFTCAQSVSSPTFAGLPNCYGNGKNTVITASTNVGLMNLSMYGASNDVASEFDNASDYIYLRQALVDLHGVNNNMSPGSPAESGNLLNVNADHFLAEDTTFSHGGVSAIKVTGSFAILRRVIGDGSWTELTGDTTYTGTDPIQIQPNDCSSGSFGCSPYGPVLIENSEIKGSGLTPTNATYNVAIRLNGLGVIFRQNYVYGNTSNYLLNLCGTVDNSATAYREGEQSVYNNTFWGGASFWTAAAGYPASVSTSICQNAIIADNLFQGAQPGTKSAAEVYAFTAGLSGVPKGTFTNQWKGWKVFSNIFGVDSANPSLNMQVTLTGTGAATALLTNSSTWASNFYNNRNVTLNWANGTNLPGQARSGLILSTTSTAGVGDNAALTTTSAAGVATLTLAITTARPFKDDWGFNGHTFGAFHTEYGDCVAVGPLTTSTLQDAVSARIATGGINYATNTITLASTVSYQSGSPVWKAIDNLDGTCGRALLNRGAAQ